MNNVEMPFASGCSSKHTLLTIIILACNSGVAFQQYLLTLISFSASSIAPDRPCRGWISDCTSSKTKSASSSALLLLKRVLVYTPGDSLH
jgi:hypothetical protein